MPVQYDEQQRPYVENNGKRVYLSPVAMGGEAPTDTTGPFRHRPQWNQNTAQWETPVDWGNVLNIGTAAALTGGALSAAGAFGGAAGGVGGIGTGASATGAGAGTAVGTGGAAAGVGGGLLGGLGKGLGWLNRAAPLLGSLSGIAGNAATGAAAGRATEAELLLRQQQLQQQTARDAAADAFNRGAYQGDDTFRRGQFAQQQQNDQLQRPSLFGRQALAGGLMQGLQDVNIGRPAGSTIPTFNVSGGLRPSAMGQQARDAGGEMSRVALMNMLSGGPAPIAMGPQADLGPGYQTPAEVPLPQAGPGGTLLGGLGLGGSLLGGLAEILKDRQAPTEQDVVLDQPNPLIFSKRPYQGLFAPPGGLR